MGSPDSSRKTALVTGASAGIGQAYAESLAADGWNLVLVARRQERLETLASRLSATHGIRAEAFPSDLSRTDDLRRAEDRCRGDANLALLVNNAGFGGYRPFVESDPSVLDAMLEVHVRAAVRLTRAALPGMVARREGAVVQVASLLALTSWAPPGDLPFRATYAASKAFLLAFGQALAGELTGTGVRSQVCLPGIVATEFHDVQGIDTKAFGVRMTPEDVVRASRRALVEREVVCVPALGDPALLSKLQEAQQAVLSAAFTPHLAARYGAG